MLYERTRSSHKRLHAFVTDSPSELNGFGYAQRRSQLLAAVQQRPFANHHQTRLGAGLNNLREREQRQVWRFLIDEPSNCQENWFGEGRACPIESINVHTA
jgi:hypothetical protein